MGEFYLGILGHVAFHLLPIMLVFPCLFAGGADWHEAAQRLDVREGRFQCGILFQ
jgi:hypothetical protein